MKKVSIEGNDFFAAQRPTTEEDNYGGIIERWDLYPIMHNTTNGYLADCESGTGEAEKIKCGHLVQYTKYDFSVFHHGFIRYNHVSVAFKEI